MNKKETALWGINKYIIESKQSLTEFQQGYLDYEDIDSSICYGKNDIEEYMEIYSEDEEDFYLKIDTKGNILESYN